MPCNTSLVPNQPKTPMRGFRIPTDLYLAAKGKAETEGRTVTDVVRDALRRYVDSEVSTGGSARNPNQ